jgi:hypothetical protein
MSVKYSCSFIMIFLLLSLSAQQFRPVQINYQYTGKVDVKDSDAEGLEQSERSGQSIMEGIVKYPIVFGKRKASIIPELTYKSIDQSFSHWNASFIRPELAKLTRLSINGVFPVTDRWSLLGAFTISQGVNADVDWNLNNSFYRFGAGFLINNTAGNRIGGALRYVEEIGFPAPLFLFFGTSKNKLWYYNVAFPAISTVEYTLNESWRLRFLERIDNDRFLLSNSTDENYNWSSLNVAIGLSYQIVPSFFFSLQAGLTPINFMTFYSDKQQDLDTVNLGLQPTIGASFYLSFSTNSADKTN